MPQIPSVIAPKATLAGPSGAQIATNQTTLLGGFLPAPKYANPQVQLDRSQAPELDPNALRPGLTEGEATAAGRQEQQVGANLSSAGGELMDVANQIQLQTNAVVADKAVNDAKEVALRLQYGSGQNGEPLGFTAIKGWDALNRPEGEDGVKKPLADEYVDKFSAGTQAIRDNLQNDAQRRAFDMQAGDIKTSLYGAATQHETQEFQSYNLSVAEGTISTEKNVIGLNYKDPVQLGKSMERIRGAVAQQGLLTSKSAAWVTAQQQLQVSDALEGAVKSAIGDQNFAAAQGLLNTYKDVMRADALVEAKGVVNKEMDARIGMSVGQAAVQATAPQMETGDFGRLRNLVMGAESAGRDRNPDGSILTSPKGAQGSMQVMPATAAKPGLGMKPLPADASDADRARFGAVYLGKLVQRYGGDVQKATAAYNAGFGAVDKAVAADPGNWLAHLPAETRAYVAKISTGLRGGLGEAPTPTWEDVQAKIDRATQPNGMPLTVDQRAHAYTIAKQQWEGLQQSKKTRDEDVTATAYKMMANGTPFDQLPTPIRTAIPGEKVPEMQAYSATVLTGKNVATNPDVQLKLMDDKYLRGLTDQQFMNLKPVLANDVWTGFAEHRRTLLAGGGQGPGDLNSPQLTVTLDGLLEQANIPSHPKATDAPNVQRVAAIHQYVRDAVLTAQRQTGKKFNDAETEAAVNRVWTRDVGFKQTFLGLDAGHTRQQILTMRQNDIPGDIQDKLRASFKKAGNNSPTEAQLLGAYWHSLPLASR